MKLYIPKDDLRNCGQPPLIFYKTDLTISKTLEEKSDSIKVDIKTQPGEKYINTAAIYVPLFRTGSLKSLLKFVAITTSIIWGQDLYTGPQKFRKTRRLVVGEALQVFEQNNWERGTDTNAN